MRLGSNRSLLFVAIGFAASGILVYSLARRFDWSSFKSAVAGISLAYAFSAVGIYLSAFLFRARRCQIILGSSHAVSIGSFLKALFVGCALNGLLPFRLGELGRAFYLQAKAGLSPSLAIGNIVTERVFDVMMLAIGALLLSTAMSVPDWLLARRPVLGAALLGFLVIAFLVERLVKISVSCRNCGVEGTSAVWTGLSEAYHRFIAGLNVVSRPGDLVAALGWSACSILLESLSYLILLRALGIHAPFGLAFFCFISIMFSGLLPAAPGNLGILQYIAIMVLAVGGINEQSALNFSLILTGLLYLPAALGLFVLASEGFGPLFQAWSGVPAVEKL